MTSVRRKQTVPGFDTYAYNSLITRKMYNMGKKRISSTPFIERNVLIEYFGQTSKIVKYNDNNTNTLMLTYLKVNEQKNKREKTIKLIFQ